MALPLPRSESTDVIATGAPTDVRRTGRMRCSTLTCELGEVVDLSAQGMRIRHRGSLKLRQGDRIEISLALMTRAVNIKVMVIWLRKTGFRKREIGLEFCDLSEDVKSALTEIARCASKLETFHPENAA